MGSLPDPLSFDWDAGNLHKNRLKHDVSSEEIEQAFFNEPRFAAPDPGHSEREPRFVLLGKTAAARLITAFFTMRGAKVRAISARPMSRKERRAYEEAQKNPPV